MWNKIGEWLGYPEDLCELFKVLGMYGLVFVVLVLWWFGILLPYLLIFDVVASDIEQTLAPSFIFSFLLLALKHFMLKDTTYWYPRLLDKLPDCPKIKWNKGE